MSHTESASIGEFIDAVWLEDGLAANTLAAYRLDLIGFEEWLRQQRGLELDAAAGGDIEAWFAAKHAQTKPSTANRRLATLRRYYLWALRHQRVVADPCLQLTTARQPLRVPKTLSEAQVEALLQQPPAHMARGLPPVRPRPGARRDERADHLRRTPRRAVRPGRRNRPGSRKNGFWAENSPKRATATKYWSGRGQKRAK